MEIRNVPTNISIDNSNTASAVSDYASYDHPPPPKRGRAYAPMGEFDLSLIREFRACPALYDRNSDSFRDKLFTSHQWQEISNKLGYDVSLLKDRMLQLRNRYNLEKRRLEQLRDENPGQHVDSPWPLFEQLHFLSEHIRPRRSYRSMLPRNSSHADTGDDDDDATPRRGPKRYAATQRGTRDSLSDGGDGGAAGGDIILNNADMIPFANGMLTVKMEEPEGENANVQASDAESGSQSGNETSNQRVHPLKLSAASTLFAAQKRPLHSLPTLNKSLPTAMKHRSLKYSALSAVQAPTAAIKIRRLDTMQERSVAAGNTTAAAATAGGAAQPRNNNIPDTNNPFNNNDNNNSNSRNVERQSNQDGNVASGRPSFMQFNRRVLSKSEQKYAAFGDFVTASLLELPAERALQLVEKFTTEVVRVLLDSKTVEEAPQPELPSPQLTQSFSHMNGSLGEALNGV